MLNDQQIEDFISRHRLPESFRALILDYYNPLLPWIANRFTPGRPFFLGINGAQGTGKSTLAEFIKFALETVASRNVAVLSIDDFYMTSSERLALSREVHPLLRTRGVPGTHDLAMLSQCLEQLQRLGDGQEMSLPRFDKSRDDRVAESSWPVVSGTLDLILFEGWCVGALPQRAEQLLDPINALERVHDASGEWRHFVNRRLAEDYANLFRMLDALVFLKAPDFDSVIRWRFDQERMLKEKSGDANTSIMDRSQIEQFVQHYERITKENLLALSELADVTLEFDVSHNCVKALYR